MTTTPTQAQIEAAAEAYKGAYMSAATHFEAMALALAAAAEVGEKSENHTYKLLGEIIDETKRLSREAQADTIERCAQVADKQTQSHNWQVADAAEAIAAAIRALKDKP